MSSEKSEKPSTNVNFNDDKHSLPPPASLGTSRSKPKVSAASIIPIWICLSAGVIIFNKYIYSKLEFQFPIFLTTWHLLFSTIGTRVLQRTTHLLDGVQDVKMTRDRYIRSILPIGLLMSGSLILSNTAYLHLSVSFIQMLKAFNPVAILLITFACRLQDPNRKLMGIVLMISSGVCIASYGEGHFEAFGFFIQAMAVVFESSRLVMIQVLLHDQKMDPLVSMYYFAPACAAMNFVLMVFFEGTAPFTQISTAGPFVLLANAMVAFGLNVAAVFLIGAGSGLVLTLAGVFKDILMITGSVAIFNDTIAFIQVIGYGIALAGLVLFKVTGGK